MKKQKTILITGISKGIGKALAIDLSKQGHNVYGTSRYPENIKDKIHGVEYLKMDLSDEKSIINCFASLSNVDILINNAGQSQMGPAEEIPGDKFREIFEVNFFGTISLTKKYVERMRKNENGLVINMGSLSGKFSVPFQSSYSSSKIALNSWTLCLRKELRPYCVQVCLIEPYFINSGILLDFVCEPNSVYKINADKVYAVRKEKLSKAYSTLVVVKTVNKVIATKSPKANYISGRKGSMFSFVNRFISSSLAERISIRVAGLTK